MAESKAPSPESPQRAQGPSPNMDAFKGAQAEPAQNAQAKPQPAPGAPQGQETGEQAAKSEAIRDLDGKFRLSLGEGLTREVSADELKTAFLERSKAEEANRQAQALLQKNASTVELAEAIQKLPPERQAAVYRAVQGIQDQQASRPSRGDDDDDFLSQAEQSPSSPQNDQYRQHIDTLTKAVQMLVQDKQQQQAQQQHKTLADQVRLEIEQFDQFNPQKVGSDKPRDFLAQAVLNDYVAKGGKGDIRELTLKWVQDYAGAVPAPQYPTEQANGVNRMASGFDDFPIPEQPATGAQISGGHALADLLRGSRRR